MQVTQAVVGSSPVFLFLFRISSRLRVSASNLVGVEETNDIWPYLRLAGYTPRLASARY